MGKTILVLLASGLIGVLSGCKATHPTFLTLQAYIPSETHTVYWFGRFPNRLMLCDSNGVYNFPDTVFLTRKLK